MYYEKLGLLAAREKGKVGERSYKLSVSQIQMVKNLYADRNNKTNDICKEFSICRTMLFSIISI